MDQELKNNCPNPKAEILRLNVAVSKRSTLSRRQADKAIQSGRIKVNGLAILNPAERVRDDAEIKLDGKLIVKKPSVYYLLNKPRDFVSTVRDPHALKKVTDLVPMSEKVVPAGRLDKASRGLLILTNDGAVVNKITHPKYQIVKKYELIIQTRDRIEGVCDRAQKGVFDGQDFLKVDNCQFLSQHGQNIVISVKVFEGKYHHLRRLFKAINCKVLDVKRTAIGMIDLYDLKIKEGKWRQVDADYINSRLKKETPAK